MLGSKKEGWQSRGTEPAGWGKVDTLGQRMVTKAFEQRRKRKEGVRWVLGMFKAAGGKPYGCSE